MKVRYYSQVWRRRFPLDVYHFNTDSDLDDEWGETASYSNNKLYPCFAIEGEASVAEFGGTTMNAVLLKVVTRELQTTRSQSLFPIYNSEVRI